MSVLIGIPRVENDVLVLRSPQGIGLYSPRAAFVLKIDTKPVCGGKADNFEMRLQRWRDRQAQGARPQDRLARYFEPAFDIGRVILTRLKRQLKIGTNERTTKLSDEFLAGITFIAPAFATKLTIKP